MSATTAAPTTDWTALADLPLRVDGYALEALHRRVTEDYTPPHDGRPPPRRGVRRGG